MNGKMESHIEEGISLCFNPDSRLSWSKERLINVVKSIAVGENHPGSKISIIIGNDRLLNKLNREWLDIDAPTDVLAFNLSDANDDEVEGEIYISLDRVLEQAVEYGVSPETELLRLAAHGMLHLCGMDHDDEISRHEMVDRGENYVRMV
jgi:rRNA maturation RNase YbeY